MSAALLQLLNPKSWLGRRQTASTTEFADPEARIRAEEAELDRQIADGTIGHDALSHEELAAKFNDNLGRDEFAV
ncbi:MAG: hypothetical protein F4X48_05540 [Acidimicrobiia bacterium]|nr:hypothetical protein [Acidimicrobiia bacterium]MYC58024.1 hypothetical protein [Acidimicrobiia bacterium]MYI30803.1 hypothetical protein [Acidimicrobiia bacterium]